MAQRLTPAASSSHAFAAALREGDLSGLVGVYQLSEFFELSIWAEIKAVAGEEHPHSAGSSCCCSSDQRLVAAEAWPHRRRRSHRRFVATLEGCTPALTARSSPPVAASPRLRCSARALLPGSDRALRDLLRTLRSRSGCSQPLPDALPQQHIAVVAPSRSFLLGVETLLA
jgi:hypothetical protein